MEATLGVFREELTVEVGHSALLDLGRRMPKTGLLVSPSSILEKCHVCLKHAVLCFENDAEFMQPF